jgi:hypothetical protein
MAKFTGRSLATAAIGLAALFGPSIARAQGSGDGFLFRKPVAALVLRGGLAAATAKGDLFSFLTDQFTLNKGDFRAPSFGGDLLVTVAPRVDLDFGVSYSGSKSQSEFRHFVDLNNLPIQQTTSLARVPLTAGARLYLASPGRSIGKFAWIPTKVVPYVGAGGGMMWYRLHQSGDFIDFKTTDVFPDSFQSSGWAPTAHAMAGVDYSVTPRLALTGEARYTWAKSQLGADFTGFNGIDLSDLGITLGLNVRF